MLKKLKRNKYLIILGVSIIISLIIETLGSYLSAKYNVNPIVTQADIASNLKSGLIYHTWNILAQAVLYFGIGAAFWKRRVAPLAFAAGILKVGRTIDLYIGETTKYNFHEAFFFINILAWLIYTTFTWNFKNFKLWFFICMIIQALLCQAYLIFNQYI